MIEIIQSETFKRWLSALGDRQAKARIQTRLDRMADGHFGDIEPVGDGVSEMRIHCGPGYRLYFMQRDQRLVILLCGGDKSSQSHDIQQAKTIAKNWKE